MRRITLLLLVMASGCDKGTNSTPSTGAKATGPAATPTPTKKVEHDYQGWKTYAPEPARFEVRFPKEPIVQAPSPASGNFHVAGLQRQTADDLAYVCEWMIQGKPLDNRSDEMVFLKGMQSGAIESLKGKLLGAKEIDSDGVPGRQYIVEAADKNVVCFRAYLAGKRVIRLQVWGKDSQAVGSSDAIKFLDSVRINK